MAETETPEVTETDTTPVARRSSATALLDLYGDDREKALARIDALVAALERLRVASIRATEPSDWLVHVGRDKDGNVIREVAYLQDSGAERAGKIWGIEVSGPAIEREDFPDGTFSYHMIAEAYSKVTGERVDYTEGSRWSGDPFFVKKLIGDEKINPVTVRKAAWANMHGRAVRALGGLNAMPVERLRQGGLDLEKIQRIDYAKGARGGESTGAGVGASSGAGFGPQLNFGRSKGKRLSEVGEKDLAWYIGAVTDSVADPAKANYKDRNESLLAALETEKARRAAPQEEQAPPGDNAPQQAPHGLTRGQRQSAIFKRIATFKGVRAAAILKALTGKESLTDLSDEQIELLEGLSDDDLGAVVTQIAEHTD
jgi:hypothetical protein